MNSSQSSAQSITNRFTNQPVYENLIAVEKLPSSCPLCPCGESGDLVELGHIIPKFVMRWLKDASKKKFFYLNNTHTNITDTIALRILCKKHERIFSGHEKNFTDTYFKKYYRNQSPPEMGGDIYYFALSVAWRILASTRMMKATEKTPVTYDELEEEIKEYLIAQKKNVGIEVYCFHAEEIIANLNHKLHNSNLLRFSIRQGIFLDYLKHNSNMLATVAPIPLVHFKLGAYYFIVTHKYYLQRLAFNKKIEPSKDSPNVNILRYSEELIGFLKHIANGDFDEVVDSAIPKNIVFNILKHRKDRVDPLG